MPFSAPLPASAQSAYAELLEVARQQDIARSVGNLSGSFNRKVVKGVPYWYYQFRDSAGAATRQVFVGRDSERLQALVAESRTKADRSLDAIAKAAMALGCAAATPSHFRIVRRLNEIGFFGAGGVLVGAHAFLAYGNALGVAWGDIGRTQDIDFAHSGRNVSLALPTTLQVRTRDAVTSLEEGFLPVPGFRPRDRTATFVSKVDKQLRVDFLTPMVGGKDDVFEHDGLGVALQPMRFIEFVLEDVQQAAVLSALGAVIVNVPDPARFALHKLLVFAERRTSNPAKARKDLRQAAALIEVLSEFRRDDLTALWRELLGRGPGWRDRGQKAVTALESLAPDLSALSPMKKAAAKTTSSARGRAIGKP
jgi:hypothetical protein